MHTVIGLMSGTSLDGVDLAACDFWEESRGYQFSIRQAETIPYSPEWKSRLSNLFSATALEFARTHTEYGRYLGELVRIFASRHQLKPAVVASHGHTIFHQPQQHFTTQIGEGAALSAECDFPVVCDFRTGDVAHGGQGAPLVPIGDALLFGEYDFCLNLGGFSNISFEKNGQRVAFDICPVNIVLNELAQQLGFSFDENGNGAKKGELDPVLFSKLNALPFYRQEPPKSLGREWVETIFMPVLTASSAPIRTQLRTATEHMAFQIAAVLNDSQSEGKKMLVTGGGAFNAFLIDCIRKQTATTVIIPDEVIVNYKEALIFAFLGFLRMHGKENCLASVTGATKNVCSGAVYLP